MENESKMIMKINDKLHGFTVTDITEVGAIGATVYMMEHDGCGAKLCYLDREDSSRTFAITFTTPPTDDTGVFHILEHSVLNGSEKFPVKEPFTELLKGSLNTFLNAMTYNDKTSYPVSSRNDKDFYNLVDIYMDAVLHPLAVKDERIFRQEGWRTEATPEGEIQLNGVVYSEMKGVYSSPDAIADYHNARLLFPNGTYQYDSGGHPEAIPTLTYESFCRAHEEHYHPSGAYIFLDGKPNLDEILPLIDSYLSPYERRDMRKEITLGDGIIEEPKIEYFEADSAEENATRVYLTYITRGCFDDTSLDALTVLTGAVADSNDAPLKGAILSSGLLDNLHIYPQNEARWGTLNIELRGVKAGREEELIAVVDKALRELVDGGIDRSLISASRARIEFKEREADFGSYPKGIVYLSMILSGWLYGMHPARILDFEKTFSMLKAMESTDAYERLLRDIISSPRATLILRPSNKVRGEREAATREMLKSIVGDLTEEKLGEIATETERFIDWQMREDSDEALATIPRLTVEDLDEPSPEIPTIVDKYKDFTILHHPIATNGITYTTLYFDASDLTGEEISALSALALAYPNFKTDKGSLNDFRRRAKATLGGIVLTSNALNRKSDTGFYLMVQLSSLDSNREGAIELCREFMYGKIIEDTSELRRSLIQSHAVFTDMLKESGHSFAAKRSAARHTVHGALREYSSGYELYSFIKAHKDDSDEELSILASRLRSLRDRLIVGERLILSVTGADTEAYSHALADILRHGESAGSTLVTVMPKKNEGIAIPSQVSYAALASNLYDTGVTSYDGAWSTLATILDFETLWSEIRVKGGAYGASFLMQPKSGTATFSSYRDPSPKNSLEVYRKAPDLLLSLIDECDDLTGYIIGSIGAAEPVTTPASDGDSATVLYIAEKSHEDVIAQRRECIETTADKLRELAEELRRTIDIATVTVVGPREALSELELDEILEL